MKKSILFLMALLTVGSTLLAQVSTTRSVSVTRTRIQTEYQYFVKFGAGALDLVRRENTYGRRSSLPVGGMINWGFRKPFNNTKLAVYWGMEYGLTSYSTALYAEYGNDHAYRIYTSDGQQHWLPEREKDHPYFSVYTHSLNATPLMIGLDLKVAPDVSVDLHMGAGLNLALFGRYTYDNGDSYNQSHGDGAISLSKNNGDNQRLYGDLQLGLGVWWKNINFEITAVAVPRDLDLEAEVPYNYVSYNQYGSNPTEYTSMVIIRGDEYFALQLMARLGISF